MASELNETRKKATKFMGADKLKILEKPFRKGASAQRRDAKAQIAKQQQMESASLAEKDDEIARRKGLAVKGGRSSLIKSATPGLATNLGGTQ